jgi:hypothetical protein
MASIAASLPLWQRLHWSLQGAWRWTERRLGWAALIGLLTLVAGIVLGVWSHDLDFQARALQARIERVEQAAKSARKPDGALRLNAFYSALPAADRIPPTVSKLIDLADDAHVTLHSAEYRASVEAAGRYLSYRISLPVSGDAKAIQSFLLASLREERTLALESITFKRERSESREIDAQIRFALLTGLPQEKSARPSPRLSAGNVGVGAP